MQNDSTNAVEARQFKRRGLLKRHLEGDESAFPELVGLYRRQVFSYIVRCGVHDSERDDIFQEIFVKVHCNARRYDSTRALEPWLFTIVANTVRSHYRKNKINTALSDSPGREPADNGPDGEAHAHARETLEWLERTIRSLPFQQREVFVLCSFSEFSQKDVAEILGLPLGTVKTYVSRSRLEIAQALARRNSTIRREVLS